MPKDKDSLPSLEEVIIAFQKELARASQATNDASKHDPNFIRGRRTLFAIDTLDIELNAGLTMDLNSDENQNDTVKIDFDAPEKKRSLIKFRVGSKPLEAIKGPRVIISRIDPVKSKIGLNRFLIWSVDENLRRMRNNQIKVIFTPLESDAEREEVMTKTDQTGRLIFRIDSLTGKYKSKTTFKPDGFKLNMDFEWVVSAQLVGDESIISIELPIYKFEAR